MTPINPKLKAMVHRVLDIENIQALDDDTSRRQFEPERPQSGGLRPESREQLRVLKRCLIEQEKEDDMSVFLKPKEIGGRRLTNRERSCAR